MLQVELARLREGVDNRSGGPRQSGVLLESPRYSRPVIPTKGHHCQVPGSLDGNCQRTLVLRAYARLASRLDLVLVRDIPGKHIDVFIIDVRNMINTERAHLSPGEVPRSASPESTTSCGRTISRCHVIYPFL